MQQSYLKLIVSSIHQSYPYILKMCQVLQPTTENRVVDHWLAQDDDLAAVTLSLSSLMTEANLDKDGPTRCFAMKE
jgi:hypothetical protein